MISKLSLKLGLLTGFFLGFLSFILAWLKNGLVVGLEKMFFSSFSGLIIGCGVGEALLIIYPKLNLNEKKSIEKKKENFDYIFPEPDTKHSHDQEKR